MLKALFVGLCVGAAIALEPSPEKVGACHAKCRGDYACHKQCPRGPWGRFREQCATLDAVKQCHMKCQSDFACHFGCPMQGPTSMSKVAEMAAAMVCHTKCGMDKACHKACHNPWAQMESWCGRSEYVKTCHQNCGTDHACHKACPKMDPQIMEEFQREPASIVEDIMNHIVPREASMEEVRECHTKCGAEHACHKQCPKGPMGRLHQRCDVLDTAKECHMKCETDFMCHLKCPMEKPTSIKEVKEIAGHMVCHAKCAGEDKACHEACGCPWAKLQSQCTQLEGVWGCHEKCGQDYACHRQCPKMDAEVIEELEEEPASLVEDIIDHIMPSDSEAEILIA